MVNYQTYIHSEEWREKSDAAKERADYRCQVCNTPDSMAQLETHHRTYERLGYEDDGDLIVLCDECHDLFERNKKIQKGGTLSLEKSWWHRRKSTFVPPALSENEQRRLDEYKKRLGRHEH